LLEGISRTKCKGQGFVVFFEVVIHLASEKSGRVARPNR
jgi:hypothetical protein